MAITQQKKRGGKWLVRVRDKNGKYFPTKLFDKNKKADAKAYERELLFKRENGSRAVANKIRILSVDGYWLLWCAECRSDMSDGWKKTQDQMFRDYVLPLIGNLRLTEVTSRDIQRVLTSAKEKGRKPRTVAHIYAFLHKFFNDAVDHFEYLQKNPVLKKHRPKIVEEESEFLTPYEVSNLLSAAKDEDIGPAIWIMCLTGLRPGEVVALKWDCIDLFKREIIIKRAWDKKMRVMREHPKGKRQTRVPMVPELVNYLLYKKQDQEGTDWVTTNCNGDFVHYEYFRRRLNLIFKESGIKRVTPHQLRHSATEIFVNGGANREDITRLLNHKTSAVTSRYMHRTDERLRKVADNIANPP